MWGVSISEELTKSATGSVGESEIKVENSGKVVYTRMNNFGLFLLLVSDLVFLTPLTFPGAAPNGNETLAYMA